MFGVLLESRARRQRRSGGMMFSAATHLAIVGAVTATITETASRPKPIEPVPVVFAPPTVKPTPTRRTETPRETSRRLPGPPIVSIDIKRIEPPTTIPIDIEPVDPNRGASLDSLITAVTNRGGAREGTGGSSGRTYFEEKVSTGPWSGAELMMRLVAPPKPRYPESLRQSGIDGSVLVRFTVDTLGRVDLPSIVIVRSTHELFTRSVRDALAALRFRPAEVGGKRVAALAEMPFEFSLTK
ncbi:MAG TPA: TonB family protein [Gemmatimonadaceae bacterium]